MKYLTHWLTAGLILLGASLAHSDPADYDTSFREDGSAEDATGSGIAWGNGVAIQTDGKIVVVGTAFKLTESDFAVIRYNSDGSLDTSFSGDGKLEIDVSGASLSDSAHGVAVDSSHNIYVVGETEDSVSGTKDAAIVKISPAGAVLGTLLPFSSHTTANEGFHSVTISGGALYATGYFDNGRIALTRVSTALTNLVNTAADHFGFGTGIALTDDGKIVVCSTMNPGASSGAWLKRFHDDATLSKDTSFDSGNAFGGAITSLTIDGSTTGNAANGVVIDSSNRPIVCGTRLAGTKIFLCRFTEAGVPDTTFGGSETGYHLTDFQGTMEVANDLALQADGKIVVVGTSSSGPGIAVIRYHSDGTRDTGFAAPDGWFTDNVSGTSGETGAAVAIQPDKKIVFAGNSSFEILVARLIGIDPWVPYYAQANATYAYFAGIGDTKSGLAYWFYFRAFGDQAYWNAQGNSAHAQREFYRGLAFFYYTLLEGDSNRLYFYYLYLAYSELTYYLALGDSNSASAYYNFYYALALSFL